MADDIGGVWRTVGGRRIFIKDGQDLKSAMSESGKFGKNSYKEYSKKVKESLKDIESDKYEDGTYDLDTKKSVEFNKGYQATFQQLNDKYTDEEYGKLVKEYQDKTDGKAYAGKFGGSPEISFHFDNEQDAIDICRKYNQVSYWDWEKMEEVKNKYYKKGKGNDYA